MSSRQTIFISIKYGVLDFIKVTLFNQLNNTVEVECTNPIGQSF